MPFFAAESFSKLRNPEDQKHKRKPTTWSILA